MLRTPVSSFLVASMATLLVVAGTVAAQSIPFNASVTGYYPNGTGSSVPMTFPSSSNVGTNVTLDPSEVTDIQMHLNSLPTMWIHPIFHAWCDLGDAGQSGGLMELLKSMGFDWVFCEQISSNPSTFNAGAISYPVATAATSDHQLHVDEDSLRGLHSLLPYSPGLERGLFQPVIAATNPSSNYTTAATRTWTQTAPTWTNPSVNAQATVQYWSRLLSKEGGDPTIFASDSILWDVLERQYLDLYSPGDAQAAIKDFYSEVIATGPLSGQTPLAVALDKGLHIDVQFVGFRLNSIPSSPTNLAGSETEIFRFTSNPYDSSVFFSNTRTLSFGRVSNILPPFTNPQPLTYPNLDYVRSAGTTAPLGGYAMIRLTGVLGGTIVTWKDHAGTTFTAELEYVEPSVWRFPISSNAATGGGFIVKIERPGSVLTGGRFTPWAQLSIL